jgi:hypothetical protein
MRRKVFGVIATLLIISLSISSIIYVRSDVASETLYVDSFDGTSLSWTEVGVSPYLNDDANNLIYTRVAYDESWFGFADSTGSGTINGVHLYVETSQSAGADAPPNDQVEFYLKASGLSEVLAGAITPNVGSYTWQSIDVSSLLDSWTKINSAQMMVQNNIRGSGGDWKLVRRAYLIVDYSVITDPPPTYSNLSYNNTVAGQPTIFSCLWTDNIGLSGFIFSSTITGSWANDTWKSLSGVSAWSKVTKYLPSSIGTVVQYKFYANDTSDNWSQTALDSLTTTDVFLCPSGSKSADPLNQNLDATKLLRSLSLNGEGQTIHVEPGQTIEVDYSYQLWAPEDPNEVEQLFFIYSWTAVWPPPVGSYFVVYSGIPGLYPGASGSGSFTINAPSSPGIYYLYWCSSASPSMEEGVATYNQPLNPPGHAKIVVEHRWWSTNTIFAPYTTRTFGIGAEHGLAQASIDGAIKTGVVMRMTKTDSVTPTGLEIHLPFYISPPTAGENRTIKYYAKIGDWGTPSAGEIQVWPIVLEDATGIYDGYGLRLSKSTTGSVTAITMYRSAGGSYGQQGVTVDWDPTDWTEYKIVWSASDFKLYVNGNLKATTPISVPRKLLVAAEITYTGPNTDIPLELDTFFDIYETIDSLNSYVVIL